MCGLAASLTHSSEQAIGLMKHRGTITNHSGSVWHRRLPIVGLGDAGVQPVVEGKWTIAFVGEVLDFREENPNAASDVPVVVNAFLSGQLLRRRDGFWSVVAVNEEKGELHFFVDYLNQKPLYYRADYRAVASEPDAAVSYGRVTPDEIYLSSVIKWGYCPETERTPYNEIKKTLPGEYVIINMKGEVTRKITDPLQRMAWYGDLKNYLINAIRRRVLSSDVPVACLLSGGLDSSIVYTVARQYGDVKPYYVYDPKNPNDEEYDRVHQVAKGTSVTIVPWANVPVVTALRMMQEPLDLGSLIPQCALSKIVKETVCLTGDGADEFFGGYTRSQRYDSQASDVYHELVNWHLPRLDRIMMAGTIEQRSPFLARRVAETALALPLAERTGKKILKDLFRDDLPPGIADQKKIPLKTTQVANDREGISKILVDTFRRIHWSN